MITRCARQARHSLAGSGHVLLLLLPSWHVDTLRRVHSTAPSPPRAPPLPWCYASSGVRLNQCEGVQGLPATLRDDYPPSPPLWCRKLFGGYSSSSAPPSALLARHPLQRP